MAVLVAPFSLFRFFWARKRNENRKQWMKPTETLAWNARHKEIRKADSSFRQSEKNICIEAPFGYFPSKAILTGH
jgi:hypothetical protein